MSKVTEIVTALALPIVKENGCELWDVEYVKEAGQWFLRVYIDKEGGVCISDCEAISRAMDPILDEKDPVPESYVFEVSSAGLERPLRRPSDFERFHGSLAEVKLYRAVDGSREYTGRVAGYDNGAVLLECGMEIKRFEKNEVANVRLRME